MRRVSKGLVPMVVALLLVTASASVVQAQLVCYQPAPIVAAAPAVSYYAPAPVVSYYAAPAPVYASYYVAPAAVTTYRYGPLGRLRGVRTYYGY